MFNGVTAPKKRCHGRTENSAECFATRLYKPGGNINGSQQGGRLVSRFWIDLSWYFNIFQESRNKPSTCSILCLT